MPKSVKFKYASFQLILVTSIAQKKTFAVFRYSSSSFTSSFADQKVFIGFNSGDSDVPSLVNIFSNINNANAVPTQIASNTGNTSNQPFTLKVHPTFSF
jgi:hypothetical protein